MGLAKSGYGRVESCVKYDRLAAYIGVGVVENMVATSNMAAEDPGVAKVCELPQVISIED